MGCLLRFSQAVNKGYFILIKFQGRGRGVGIGCMYCDHKVIEKGSNQKAMLREAFTCYVISLHPIPLRTLIPSKFQSQIHVQYVTIFQTKWHAKMKAVIFIRNSKN